MPDYTLSARITGDSKNYQNAVKKAEESTSKFKDTIEKLRGKQKNAEKSTEDLANKQRNARKAADELGNSFSKLAGRIKTLIAAAGLAKLALQGITYNADIEQYQTSFEVMTGSAEKAAETVETLKKLGAATPFELPDLANTTQLLMNYGFSADVAVDRLRMLGDISQGSADKMSRIATAYGQMSSAGKVSLEDVKQMIEAGFNPLQEISETTGESMSSLYKRISDGTLSIDEITQSMQRSTSEGGKYFQSMSKQSQTLKGRFSTLKDTVSEFLGGHMKPLADFLRDSAIPFVIELLQNWEKYEPVLITLGIALGTVTALIIAYNIQQSLASSGLTIWQAVAGAATGVTTALGAAFTFLTSPIGLIILAIGALIAIGYLLVTHWDEVKAFASETWSNIQGIFQDFDDWLSNIFATDWSENFNEFGEILNVFFASASGIWESIKKIFSGVVDFIVGIFTGDWSRAWDGVVSIFGGIFGGIVSIAKLPINALIGLINSAIGELNKISFDVPSWMPIFGGRHFGVDLPKIPYLAKGTDNWQGGLAIINEYGNGELVNLPNGSQVIPHDISEKYAKESARLTNSNEPLDIEGILDGVTILVDARTTVDGKPLREMVADYTIKKMGARFKNSMTKKGVTPRGAHV